MLAGAATKLVAFTSLSLCGAENKVQLFDTYLELREHDHEVHDHCTECDRGFKNQHNLQQHLNSRLHWRMIKCEYESVDPKGRRRQRGESVRR